MCCGVGASWKVDGVMTRGNSGELLGYESRSREFQRIEVSSGIMLRDIGVLWLHVDININILMIVGVDLLNGRGYDGNGTGYPYRYPLHGPGTCSACLHMHIVVAKIATLKRIGQHGILEPYTCIPIRIDYRCSTV